MDSILKSIKHLLGGCAEDDDFDTDIIMHINTVISQLEDKGVPAKSGFSISDEMTTWEDYLPEINKYQYIKTFIYLKVKLAFDPPANASVLKAMEHQVDELDWFIDNKFNYELKPEEENQNGSI